MLMTVLCILPASGGNWGAYAIRIALRHEGKQTPAAPSMQHPCTHARARTYTPTPVHAPLTPPRDEQHPHREVPSGESGQGRARSRRSASWPRRRASCCSGWPLWAWNSAKERFSMSSTYNVWWWCAWGGGGNGVVMCAVHVRACN